MAFELQVTGSRSSYLLSQSSAPELDAVEVSTWETVFQVGDVIFAGIFILDVALRILVLQCLFWKVWMNYIDVAVSVTTLAEVAINLYLSLGAHTFKCHLSII